MSPRLAALLLAVAAGLLHAGVAVPARTQGAAAAEEYRRLREQRRETHSRLARLERREAAREQAMAVVSLASTEDPPTRLRRNVVECLKGAEVTGVRLSVRPAVAPAAATLRLSARGPFREVVRLSGRLVDPSRGVFLERVRFAPAPGGVVFELEGLVTEGDR